MIRQQPRRAYPDVLPPVPVAADEADADARHRLTETDRGRLPEETRRVLVQLLSGPYVMRERHPKLWPALLRDEDAVRERLGDLFLVLVLDRDAGLAYVKAMTSPTAALPRTIRSTPLTLIDTALVLHLRGCCCAPRRPSPGCSSAATRSTTMWVCIVPRRAPTR